MNEKYFLCTLRWDAQQRREVVQAKSSGHDTVAELLKAAEPWIQQNLGRKIVILKYRS